MFDYDEDTPTNIPNKIDFGVGKMKLEDGWKSENELGFMGTEFGDRESSTYVKFNFKFDKIPHVHVGLSLIDTGNNANTRLKVYAKNITKEGFDLVFFTWVDSSVWKCEANWIAIQN